MSPTRSNSARKLRGAQKWIVDELRAIGPEARLATSQLAKRIAKSSKKDFHMNSVYNALRILARKGTIDVVRQGRQKFYQIAGAVRRKPGRPPGSKNVRAAPTPLPAAASTPALPHKLALGEILVLSVNESGVLTATNLHGRLVVERHPVPG